MSSIQDKKQHTRQKGIPALQAPTQRILYKEPIQYLSNDKKYKLNTTKDAFIFTLSKQHPHIIFLMYNGKTTPLNKLLKAYTGEEHIKQQFIKLLEEPAIIQDKITTLLIIEAIYMFSGILNIDLTQFITHSSLDNIKNYYFVLHRLNKNNKQ